MITRDDVLVRSSAAVPETDGVVGEHLEDNGELLLHLLMSDLPRFTVEAFADGRLDLADRLLAFTDTCLLNGDAYVGNAVAVSFVEHFGACPGESDALLQRRPAALRSKLGR